MGQSYQMGKGKKDTDEKQSIPVAQRECEFPYADDPERGLPAHPEHDSARYDLNGRSGRG